MYCYVFLDDDFQDLYEPQAILLGSNNDNFICIKKYCYVLLCMLPILLDVNLFLSTASGVRHWTKQYSELWIRAKLCKLEPITHVQPTNKQTSIWWFLMVAALKPHKVCQIVSLVSCSNLWCICWFSSNVFIFLLDLPGCVVAIPCHRSRWFTSDNHVILSFHFQGRDCLWHGFFKIPGSFQETEIHPWQTSRDPTCDSKGIASQRQSVATTWGICQCIPCRFPGSWTSWISKVGLPLGHHHWGLSDQRTRICFLRPLNNLVVLFTAAIAYFYLHTRFKMVHYAGAAMNGGDVEQMWMTYFFPNSRMLLGSQPP